MKTVVAFLLACSLGGALTRSDIINMKPNTWLSVPGTNMRPVGATHAEFPFLKRSTSRIDNILDYSGGILDTKRERLVIWGGGHNSYDGNELYAFDCNTFQWERLMDPSVPNICNQVNGDGTPIARHTYSGMAYIGHADRFFGTGGAIACHGSGCGLNITWTYDFTGKKWKNQSPKGELPNTLCDNFAAYDPVTKKVWWNDGHWSKSNGLFSYDYDANTWTRHSKDLLTRVTATVDTKRGLLVGVGRGKVLTYAIRTANPAQTEIQTTGQTGLVGKSNPGLAYDPVADKIVGWSGGSPYSLSLDTKVWTSHSSSGAPALNLTGVYGLWRYVPSLNAFVVMTDIDKDIHFFKLTAGAGTVSRQNKLRSRFSALKVQPNPAQRFLTIRFPGQKKQPAVLRMVDASGQTLRTLTTNGSNLRKGIAWNTEKLPAGLYFLSLETSGQRFSKKVLVQK